MAQQRDDDAWELWNRRLKESVVWIFALGLAAYETVEGQRNLSVYGFCTGLLTLQLGFVLDRVRKENKP